MALHRIYLTDQEIADLKDACENSEEVVIDTASHYERLRRWYEYWCVHWQTERPVGVELSLFNWFRNWEAYELWIPVHIAPEEVEEEDEEEETEEGEDQYPFPSASSYPEYQEGQEEYEFGHEEQYGYRQDEQYEEYDYGPEFEPEEQHEYEQHEEH